MTGQNAGRGLRQDRNAGRGCDRTEMQLGVVTGQKCTLGM